jgi:hypothetical protein
MRCSALVCDRVGGVDEHDLPECCGHGGGIIRIGAEVLSRDGQKQMQLFERALRSLSAFKRGGSRPHRSPEFASQSESSARFLVR